MHSLFYDRARDIDEAIALASQPGARYIGGGTNLLDLYKSGVEMPQRVVDITRLPLAQIAELPGGGLRIGALASNTAAANHPLVRRRYPLLAEALLSGASAQLRNMATMGGNLMQRTRCFYFTDPAFERCNKRRPGSGCGAREGFNRNHAILGASQSCIAVNPSDMSVALAALDADVVVRGAQGERRIPIDQFHRLPGDQPQRDTNLEAGELIVAIELPPSSFSGNSHYLKVRDRASYAFALVSAAAALAIDNGVVSEARIVLGGVAHKPWRARDAEACLVGKPLTPDSIAACAVAAVAGAQAFQHNAFKIPLAQRAIARALRTAGERA
jgi:xanthine dehydrogenase YagS FAD-binding subunit